MKVLFVSSGNSHYGVVPFIRNQGESLAKQGVEVDFYPLEGKGLSGYLKNIKKLRKHLIHNNYDLLHAHYSLIGMITVLTLTKKPIVLSLMGSDAYGDYNLEGKRILKSYLPMIITQILQPFLNVIIVKSKNIMKYVYRKKITHLVPNGVNFDRFKPMNREECRQKLGLPLDKKLVLFLANPDDPRKNFQLLEKSIPHLQTKNVEVINPFPIKNEDFPYYLNACDVFVLTSYNEGSPNVIKEAMACNCPIVSTDVGDVKEVISGTEGCYLVSFDHLSLASNIDKVLKRNRKTKGRNNIPHLNDEKVAEKIISIYQSVLKIT